MKYLLILFIITSCASFKPVAPEKEKKFFKVAWNKNLDPDYQTGNLPIGLGAPRVFNDIVYMGSLSGIMRAYDLESGRVLWSQDEKTPLNGAAEKFGDFVAYGGENGRFFVRHYLTGALKYAIDLGSPVESAPLFNKGRMLIYLRGHQIVHLDAETGKVLWAYKRAVPITTTLQRTTKPLILGNKIIVGFADGHVGALSVDEGLLLWETKVVDQGKFVDVDLNPILAGGSIITGSASGNLVALNPDSGTIALSYDHSVQAHPILKGEQLILGTTDGELILMGLNGDVLKRVKISDKPISAVGWWKDNLIAASFDGKIRAIDPLTLNIIDHFSLGYNFSAVYSDIVITGDYLTIYSSRNRLYIFK